MTADKNDVIRLLKTARGQMDGLIKMVEEDRYCIDISNQILATEAILSKINKLVLRAHMRHCVKQAFEQGNEDEKIDELINLFDKLGK